MSLQIAGNIWLITPSNNSDLFSNWYKITYVNLAIAFFFSYKCFPRKEKSIKYQMSLLFSKENTEEQFIRDHILNWVNILSF